MKQQNNKQTYELIKKAKSGDKYAKNMLIQNNMGLIYSIAKRFYGRGYDNEDINQIGAIGLIKAINKFEPSYNVCFSTYAVPLIIGEIKLFLRDDGPLKVSRTLKHIASETARITDEIQKKEGRIPGVLEIAKALNLNPGDIIKAREASATPESFFAVCNSGSKTLADFLPDKEKENDLLDILDLKKVISNLPKREKSIIIMRYFFDKTQSEIAEKLGISQVQVSRLEKKILETFRKNLQYEL